MEATQSTDRLKNRDYLLVIDKSGSMEEKDTPTSISRWNYCEESTLAIARKLNEFDPDGITVVPFATTHKMYENTTPEKVKNVFQENSPMGGTNLSPALQACFDAYLATKKSNTAKANGMMVVVITDGQPNDGDQVAKTIVNFSKKLDTDNEAGISFLQIGKDQSASMFLKRLDDDLQKEGAKFDIVDAKTMEDLENTSLIDAMIAALDD